MAPSDHFDGRRFFNPTPPAQQPISAVPRMMTAPRTPWPARVDQPLVKPPPLDGAAAVVTFIGQATFLIQTAAGNLLTDPMYSQRAFPVQFAGPRRVRQPAVAFDNLPPISTVLLSHNHYDHCDRRTLSRLARRDDPIVVTPLGNGALVRSTGIRRVEELDWWQESKSVAWPATLTPAHHFSARTPFDRNRALWGGFVLTAAGRRIYFAGDTAYAPFFRDIPARLGPLDLALLPIGAYEPRWFMQPFHMTPEEAVRAHREVGARVSIATHHSYFRLADDGFEAPARLLADARAAAGVPPDDFRVLDVGETAVLGQ